MLAYPYTSFSVDILVHLVGIASVEVCVSVCMCVSVYAEGGARVVDYIPK